MVNMTYQGPDHFADILDGMQDIDDALENLEDEANMSQRELRYVQFRTQQLQDEIQEGRGTAQAIADYEQDIATQINGIEPNQVYATVVDNNPDDVELKGPVSKLGGYILESDWL